VRREAPFVGRVFSLTGGIGSGKSTVAAIFRERGLTVVDADQLARRAVEPGSAILDRIRETFGEHLVDCAGVLDRKGLAAIVFANGEKREQLNALVHPEVQRLAEEKFQEAFARGDEWVCYEVPLLFETGQQERYRPVVVVATSMETQLARASARDGEDADAISRRISAQLPLEDKVLGADYVIENDRTLEALRERSLVVLDEILAS
jgi:dephospho-CoA kinase